MKIFKVFLATLLVLGTHISWAQSLPGGGTETNPYLINNQKEWDIFVSDVNNGITYKEKYIELRADVSITSIEQAVGVWNEDKEKRKTFSGIFIGCNHTITINLRNSTAGQYTAPFVCVSGARIKQLTITGDIITNVGNAAGVVGCSYGSESRIENHVYVNVNITNGAGRSAGDNCAGVAVDASYLQISTCYYKGQIIAGTNSAGFCVIGESKNTKINNCLFDPADRSSIAGGENFVANNSYQTYNPIYYTYRVGRSTQGVRAYKTYEEANASNDFTQLTEMPEGSYYYVVGTGAITVYYSPYYQSHVANGGLTFDVTYNGTIVEESNYRYRVKTKGGSYINIADIEPGAYILEVTMRGNNTGTLESTFEVVKDVLAGAGTEEDPYRIGRISDWNNFADAVNGGHSFAGEYLILTRDITITVDNTSSSDKMVGVMNNTTESKWFSGTFDGKWFTLTFNAGTKEKPCEPATNSPTAPFRVIDGATIKNVIVKGTIVSKKKYNAGLIGMSFGAKTGKANNIKNCRSSIQIDCSQIDNGGNNDKRWDCSAGGFAAENKNGGQLLFEQCVFDGKIDKKDNAKANRGAGFVSYNNGGANSIKYTDCLMAGTIILNTTLSPSYQSTFSRYGKLKYEGENLFTNNYGDVPQKNCVEASMVCEGVSKNYKVDTVNYYVPLEVTELKSGEFVAPITVEVKFYGQPLEKGEDYRILIEKKNSHGDYEPDDAIDDPSGAYRVTITGLIEKGFDGESVYEFKFITDDEQWDRLIELIDKTPADGKLVLPNDFFGMEGDVVLEITKNITINLAGHTINRNLSTPVVKGQVMRIAQNVDVTIVGPGTITGGYNVAANDNELGPNNDGGGIYNMGNLVVIKNVSIVNNKCIKYTEGSDAFTARGGGVFNGIGSSFNMVDGEVSNNIARGGGGGVYCQSPTSFSLENVVVDNNESESKGGGLRIRTTSPVEATLTNCVISNNRATATGATRASEAGGVYMQEGKLRMENCLITKNQSAFAGAGFYANGGETYAKNCQITYNTAFTEHERMYGGGICLRNPSVYTMDGGTIEHNHSFQEGGGIYVFQGATFNVLGKVVINENFRTRSGADPEDTPNNAYVSGTAVINIVGDLDPKAIIHITGHGIGGVYTSGMKDHVTYPENFVTDGKYQKLNDWQTLDEINLAPYIWYQDGTWGEGIPAPEISTEIVVDRAFELEEDEIGYAKSIEFSNGRVVLKDGAQLVCYENANPEVPVEIFVRKTIEAATEAGANTYGWYAISLPIDDVSIKDDYENNTNLVTKSKFDLLRYDEPTHYWDSYSYENYQSQLHGKFQTTEKGRGYLYRNKENVNLEFSGKMLFDDVVVKVTTQGDKLTGFNLLGNPFTHTIYKGDGNAIPNKDILSEGYFVMSKDGKWETKTDADPIPICQAILVQALREGEVRMTNTTNGGSLSKSDNAQKNIMFAVSNDKYEDVAYAKFDKGHGLTKIEHLNDQVPMVYVRQNNNDYAIAVLEKTAKSFDLCFKPMTTSQYTLSVKADGDFSYLHVIDRLTGTDIDMLKENEYSFVGSILDDDDRFIVSVVNADDDSQEFAHQNGDDIVIWGVGELQIFDVTGRHIYTKQVNGVEAVQKPSQNGVYILRLIGRETKTQKIVVR